MATITNKRSETGEMHKLPALWTIATAILIVPSHSSAAEWKIAPTLEVKETYTDNVRLVGPGAEKGDFVTQISPGISMAGTGRGLKFKASYALQNLFYAREKGQNSTMHQLNADANAELVNELLFFDGKAAISRQNISAFGPQPVDNINITDNRTEVRTYSASPYLSHRFGSTASTELRYTHDSVNASTGGLLSSQSDRIAFNLNSGPAFKTLGWGLQYNGQKIAYSNANANSVTLATSSGSLRYMISPRFAVTATAGYEKNNYFSIKEKPEGYFWTTGISWQPSERTSIITSAGKRFYGKTFSLAANHRSRATVWNIGYNEDITTTQSQFLVPVTIDTSGFLNQLWSASIPDATARQQAIDAFIRDTGLPASLAQSVNTFTNRVFLQKNLQASVALNGAKNTLLLSVFNISRDAQTAQAIDSTLLGASSLTLDDNTRQTGVNAMWNWRISPRTNANISTGYSRVNSLSTGRTDRNKTIRLALAKQFQPKFKGTIELRRLQQESNQIGGEFRENAISASLLMGF